MVGTANEELAEAIRRRSVPPGELGEHQLERKTDGALDSGFGGRCQPHGLERPVGAENDALGGITQRVVEVEKNGLQPRDLPHAAQDTSFGVVL